MQKTMHKMRSINSDSHCIALEMETAVAADWKVRD